MKKITLFTIVCFLSLMARAQTISNLTYDSTFLTNFRDISKEASAPGTVDYTFDGIDDYVELTDLSATNELTVSMAFRRTGYSTESQTLWENGGSGSGFTEASITLDGNHLSANRWDQSATASILFTENWHVITAVFTTTSTKLYINGELKATMTASNYGPMSTVSGVHQLGRFRTPDISSGDPKFFTGEISEFSITPIALSAFEIKSSYDVFDYFTLDGVADYFPLDDLSSTNNLSVTALVKRNGDVSEAQTIWVSGGEGGGFAEASVRIKGNQVSAIRWNQLATATYNSIDDWFRVTAVFTTDSTSLYINSDLVAVKRGSYSGIRTVNGNNQVGKFRNSDKQFLNGNIDEFKLLQDSILTSTELALLDFTPGVTPSEIELDYLPTHFDGVNDYLEGTALPIMDELTVNVWAKRSGSELVDQVIWDNGGNGSGFVEALIKVNRDQVTAARWTTNATATYTEIDEWFMVTAVYTSNSISLFINGDPMTTTTGTFPDLRTVNGTHQFGRFRTSASNYFMGDMTNFALYYDQALTETEIKNIYNNSLGTVTSVFESNEGNNITIYPNPASTFINTEEGQLDIFDALGNHVISTESTGQVDVSSLASGIYLVSQNGKRTKLVIE